MCMYGCVCACVCVCVCVCVCRYIYNIYDIKSLQLLLFFSFYLQILWAKIHPTLITL